MSIYVLKRYVEECRKNGDEPTFEGLKIYYVNEKNNKEYKGL